MTRVFLAAGFRPFYLVAALFAAFALPAWVAAYHGWWAPASHLPGSAWHSHEMLFGFAGAVIVGFLLTAARNWTGRATADGAALGALVALWLAGRLLNVVGPGSLAAWVDAGFLPVSALVLAVPLLKSGNRRNLFVVPLLVMLGGTNLLHHGAFLGWTSSLFGPAPQAIATSTALGLIALLMTVIGGRVIPSFAANAVPGLRPQSWAWLETTVVVAMVAIVVADLLSGWWRLPRGAFAGLLAVAGGAQVVRLLGWTPWRARHNALLVMLPVAYAWIPVYLVLRAVLGSGGQAVPATALHALVIGAMSSLMLAMMTRSALGHTGRPLRAGAVELTAFGAMQCAAALRVAGPGLAPGHYDLWITLSGIAATLAVATFAVGYWPILTRPRVDGRPG